MGEEKPRIVVSSYGGHEGGFSFRHLQQEEIDTMHALVHGQCYVRIEDGRLKRHDHMKPLPEPEDDPAVGEGWQYSELQPHTMGKASYGPVPAHGGCSITIQHLCGYRYTEENYAAQAKRLKSYGFVCMRSKRGRDARFWELWYLPGLWMAQGELREYIGEVKTDGEKQDRAFTFLMRSVSFGTMDAAYQRAAMVID